MATESLRDRQKRMARETMLCAAAELIVERGTESVALTDVAERAGVSNRTLYNYFESREALFSGINDWSSELSRESGGLDVPEGLDTLPDVVRTKWIGWAEQGTLALALIRLSAAGNVAQVADERRLRHEAFAAAVLELRPDLGVEQAGAIGSMLHAVCSGAVFERMVVQEGVDAEVAADLAAWVASLIRQGLAGHDDPDIN